jgi:hypothetical protein
MSYIGQAQTSNVLRTVTKLTATAGQTVFPVYGGYALGFVDVYLNGILLLETTDYTATDGANITLVAAAALNDEVTVIAYTPTTQIANKAEIRQTFVATGGQVNFPVTGGYNPGMISVYLNGVKLVNGTDVTVSSGTNVVFGSGLTSGDIVDVVGLVSFAVADAVRKTGDTMTGDLDVMANIGVGTTTPNKGGVGRAVTLNTASGGNIVEMCVAEDRKGWVYADDSRTALAAGGNRLAEIQTNGLARIAVDGSGRVTTPYQPAFKAQWANQSYVFGGGEAAWDTAVFNIGSHYNTANGRFTAPVAGVYQFNLTIQHYGATGSVGWQDIRVNGAEVNARYEDLNTASLFNAGGLSVTLYLNAGDYVSCISSSAVWWSDNSSFSGFLVG